MKRHFWHSLDVLVFGAIFVQPICCLLLNSDYFNLLVLWVYKITYIYICISFAKNKSLPPCQMIAKANVTSLVMCVHTHTHTRARTHARTHAHTRAHTHTHVHTHAHTHPYT